jgi:hypothetical protein
VGELTEGELGALIAEIAVCRGKVRSSSRYARRRKAAACATQNSNRATIWPDLGWAPPLPGLPPFTQFTNPQPDDRRPGTPLKVLARPVGVVIVVDPLLLGI